MKQKSRLTYTQIIFLSFVCVILIGTLLLWLPVSSVSGTSTPLFDCLFTSVSSTCVIGLSMYNTVAHWSVFGQIVILCLIQIGGLGFISIVLITSLLAKKQLSLSGRRLIMVSSGSVKLGGITEMLKSLIKGTLAFEALGSIILTARFLNYMPFSKALYYGVFHSVSAFCNAGVDLFGNSLMDFRGDITVNLTVMALSLIGGLGFFVWSDLKQNKFNFKKHELHSKIAITATIALVAVGWIGLFFSEASASMKEFTLPERILSSLFQSVSPRTVGFTTVDIPTFSKAGSIIVLILMFIGGNPGSTAGGIKTTTAVIILAVVFSSIKGSRNVQLFKRRIDEENILHAVAVVGIYVICIIISVIILCLIEPFSLKDIVFEIVAAIGTSGISMGITGSLTTVSQMLLMFLMLTGRIGGLTLMWVFANDRKANKLDRPSEKILVG